MPSSTSFVTFALDLLALVGPVQARSMFGGHGVYARGVMFALLDDDELFFKTDGETRERFLAAGCRMWVYPGIPETHYYRPPDEAHEDPEAMLPWARLALEAALRAKAAKDEKARAAAERRTAREAKAARATAGAAPARRSPRGRGTMATCAASPPSSSSRSRAGSASAPGSGSSGRKRSPRTRRRS